MRHLRLTLMLTVLGAFFVVAPASAQLWNDEDDSDTSSPGYLYDYDRQSENSDDHGLRTSKPRYGSTYDWQSGNTYRWQRDPDGSTTVNGFNTRTGSTWRTEIERDGDMSGRDSRGNYWRYDASTGFYTNTDGTVCMGRGTLRTCN